MKNVYWVLELEIQAGQTENFESLMKDMVASTQKNEPGTLNYEWHADADRTTCHIYERYVDSAAVMTHMAGFAPFAGRFSEVFVPQRFSVYGSPSEEVKDALGAFSPTYLDAAEGFAR